jgi:hypothetical protein
MHSGLLCLRSDQFLFILFQSILCLALRAKGFFLSSFRCLEEISWVFWKRIWSQPLHWTLSCSRWQWAELVWVVVGAVAGIKSSAGSWHWGDSHTYLSPFVLTHSGEPLGPCLYDFRGMFILTLTVHVNFSSLLDFFFWARFLNPRLALNLWSSWIASQCWDYRCNAHWTIF